jgi:hypothetical protein
MSIISIISLVVFFVGVGCLAMCGVTFWFRAVLNKQAWGGLTLPFLWIGLIAAVLGLTVFIIFYNSTALS